MKKIICNVLAVVCGVCALTSLTACKGGDYNADNFLTLEEATALGTPNKIVKEKTTIKVFVPKGSMNPAYSSMRMFKVLSEETNLNFDFVEADEGQYMTLRSVAWEDKNNLPDLFLYNNTISEIIIYSAQGALTPFNDPSYKKNGVEVGSLIDNYMPNYKALLDDNFGFGDELSAHDILTVSDGKMYSVASVNNVPRDLTFKMYINQDWIDILNEYETEFANNPLPNADDMDTVEEYLRVLRAFKKYEGDLYQGTDGIVPVTAANLDNLRNMIMASYGHVTEGVEIKNDGSAFEYSAATEGYRKYLETVRTMYAEKLLDQTVFSTSATDINAKGYAGRLGSFISAAAYIVVGASKDSQYVTCGPFTSEYYTDTPIQYAFSKVDALGAVVPSTTNYSREIARLLDLMYSDFGVSLSVFGQENVDWKWDNDEKTSWSKIIPETWKGSSEEYRATLTPNVGLGVSLYYDYDFIKKDSDPDAIKLNKQAERYADYLKEPIPFDIQLTADEYNKESLIGSSLESKVKEWEYRFVTGVKNPSSDADWNEYLNELKGYRYEELVALYNAALARK